VGVSNFGPRKSVEAKIMATPFQAWAIVLIASSITFLIWIVSAPVISAMYTATSGQISDEAQGAANMMRLEFIVFPVIITVGLTIWAALVTTRRQAVTTPGGWY